MKKMVVADVKGYAVCRFKGEWGVLGRTEKSTHNEGRRRAFHRWHAPPISLKPWEIVEVLDK